MQMLSSTICWLLNLFSTKIKLITTLDIAGVEAKLVAVEGVHGDQIKEQKKNNVFLEDEKKNLEKKVDELEDQLQQHMYAAHLLTLLPPIG